MRPLRSGSGRRARGTRCGPCRTGRWASGPLKYSIRIWRFREASTPSTWMPARSERSSDQPFSSRCCRSAAAIGRQPTERARPRADELDAVLDGPRVQAGRLLIEQVAAARVETQDVAELPRDLEVDALVGEVHALGIACAAGTRRRDGSTDGRGGTSPTSPRSAS